MVVQTSFDYNRRWQERIWNFVYAHITVNDKIAPMISKRVTSRSENILLSIGIESLIQERSKAHIILRKSLHNDSHLFDKAKYKTLNRQCENAIRKHTKELL